MLGKGRREDRKRTASSKVDSLSYGGEGSTLEEPKDQDRNKLHRKKCVVPVGQQPDDTQSA